MNKWLMLSKNLVKSRNITEVQLPTRCSESVEKFTIVQTGCIDVAAVGMVKRVSYSSVPNFVAIGPTVGEMAIFYFSRWRPPPFWIFKISHF